ncbi:MAG: phosphotransferase [Demequina sp.]|uniref:phosphotransferase n=1 Tax=Demequina sp. TaxID=2050685 RepID=UPI003A83965F
MTSDTTTAPLHSLAPSDLAARLEALPEWPFGSTTLDRIDDGITNVNFIAHTAHGDVFVKIPGAGTSAFVSMEASTEATRVAAEQGVAPRVLYFDAISGVQATELLVGYRSAGAQEFADPAKVMQVFALYRRLHGGALLTTTKTLFDMIDEHLTQLTESHVMLQPYQQEVVDLWAHVQARYVAAGLDIVPGHNDMMPSNYMFGPEGDLKLIDYDYAANTDRFYEIGGIITLFGFPEAVQRQLVEVYLGHAPSDGDMARVYLSGMGAAVKWGLWGLYNAAVRDADFDYDKYGAGMLAYAHRMLASPKTARALSHL